MDTGTCNWMKLQISWPSSKPLLGKFPLRQIPFNLFVVGVVFQCKLDAIFTKLNFFTHIDGISIMGEQANGSDYDQHLTEFLHLKRQHKLILSYHKVQFKAHEVRFLNNLCSNHYQGNAAIPGNGQFPEQILFLFAELGDCFTELTEKKYVLPIGSRLHRSFPSTC